ncbi:Protein of unknown function [Loktanella fryxellensis]|uniref:DUF2948 domain-containing protein n=1 Tax=Loktanella fryxellensis TaxID=245187 RepID=A0A1H8JZ87_9RHOB|nr:DUF2948 family protein [Loktanella fryxellensis]SEN86013.1 Protein of unknown function [Loktanella fryxellensis]
MTEDARFQDGVNRPLALIARDAEDLQVISALVQDAVFPASEMRWTPADRRFAILLNRFRWEDADRAGRRDDYERVQAVLWIADVSAVRSQGVPKGDPDTILSLLSLEFHAEADGSGEVVMTLAGDGVIAARVEVLEVVLRDVTRPYVAPSRKAPRHPD